MGEEQTHINIFMHTPAYTRPVLIIAPQYSFYSIFVHCEIVVCCPIICADIRGSVLEPIVPASLPPATPLEVHWRTLQIVGGLPSQGDTSCISAESLR